MSQENVALHYQAFEAVNGRDLEAFLALVDRDIEFVSRIVAVEGGLHGHDGVRIWWDNWFQTWPDYKAEVLGIRDAGDATVATYTAVGHGAGSGMPFEDKAWMTCRWRSGKCIWMQVLLHEADAFEAAGLSE